MLFLFVASLLSFLSLQTRSDSGEEWQNKKDVFIPLVDNNTAIPDNKTFSNESPNNTDTLPTPQAHYYRPHAPNIHVVPHPSPRRRQYRRKHRRRYNSDHSYTGSRYDEDSTRYRFRERDRHRHVPNRRYQDRYNKKSSKYRNRDRYSQRDRRRSRYKSDRPYQKDKIPYVEDDIRYPNKLPTMSRDMLKPFLFSGQDGIYVYPVNNQPVIRIRYRDEDSRGSDSSMTERPGPPYHTTPRPQVTTNSIQDVIRQVNAQQDEYFDDSYYYSYDDGSGYRQGVSENRRKHREYHSNRRRQKPIEVMLDIFPAREKKRGYKNEGRRQMNVAYRPPSSYQPPVMVSYQPPTNYQPPVNVIYQPPMNSVYQAPVNTGYQPPITVTYAPPMNTLYQQPKNAQYQPPMNTQYQPPMNTQYQPPMNTQYQPPRNTQYQPPMNTQYQPPMNTQYQPPMNTQYQPPMNTQYQPPMNTQYQPPVNTQYQPPMNTQYQRPMNTQYQRPKNTQHRRPMNTQYQPPMNHQYQPPMNTQYQQPINTQYQRPTNTQYQPPMNTQYQPPMNTQYSPPMNTGYQPQTNSHNRRLQSTEYERPNNYKSSGRRNEDVSTYAPVPRYETTSSKPAKKEVKKVILHLNLHTEKPNNRKNKGNYGSNHRMSYSTPNPVMTSGYSDLMNYLSDLSSQQGHASENIPKVINPYNNENLHKMVEKSTTTVYAGPYEPLPTPLPNIS